MVLAFLLSNGENEMIKHHNDSCEDTRELAEDILSQLGLTEYELDIHLRADDYPLLISGYLPYAVTGAGILQYDPMQLVMQAMEEGRELALATPF